MGDGSLIESLRTKCRIWWPTHLSSCNSPGPPGLLLFGWFISASSSSSIDVVVAFALEDSSLRRSSSYTLKEAIKHVRERMPVLLQDRSSFSILGKYVQDSNSIRGIAKPKNVDCDGKKSYPHGGFHQRNLNGHAEEYNRRDCGCENVDYLQDQHTGIFCESFRCIQLVYDPYQYYCKGIGSLPKVHHFHWDGDIVRHCDLHVILYDTPTFGSHHFPSTISCPKCTEDPSKRPQWVSWLCQRHQSIDLDTVMVAINSAEAADRLFDRRIQGSCSQCSVIYKFLKYGCNLFAVTIATFSTLLYIVLQVFHGFMRLVLDYWIFDALLRIFSNARKNIELRCSQILYWPIFLKQAGFRSSSSVEYAEKAALREHSTCSSVVVDVILGNLVGFVLFLNPEFILKWVLILASRITDDILRTGSAWLMGVPAGFKLNTELAEILGMASLNVIQIWSTLWSFAICLCYYAIKVSALCGIFLGITIPAAMLMDIMTVAAKHVSSLHWLMSLLYSHQIQALTALWRLFRGRKWNPLRERLDSYNYTVEQHIVGALLFTPLLLLVPTTSIFYMFFAIMNTTTVSLCIVIEVTISVIHATPYSKIFLWLLRPKRFPSGIWFEMICYRNSSSDSSAITYFNEVRPGFEHRTQETTADGNHSTLLLSKLQSNTQTFRQLILPHYRGMFSGVHTAANPSSVYGILTGKRLPTLLGAALPSPMPWVFVSFRDYWCICYDSVSSYLDYWW